MKRSVTSLFRLLGDMFPGRERLRMVVVLVTAIIAALFEALGVVSILPFMAVVMDPSALDKYALLRYLGRVVGDGSIRDRLLLLGAITGLAIVTSNAVAAAALWSQQQFIARSKVRLAASLFDAYLSQPYGFHIRRDAPSLVKVVQTDADSVVRLVQAALQFVARVLVILALLALLLAQNPTMALWTVSILGGSYAVIYGTVRKRQEALGREWVAVAAERQRCLQEGLAGIKDLLVLGREAETSRRYRGLMERAAAVAAETALAGALPRYLLEPLAFGGILVVAIALLIRDPASAAKAIPMLALYAFVGYRLLPALQQMFASAVEMRYYLPSLEVLHTDWMETHAVEPRLFPETIARLAATPDKSVVRVAGITFYYPGALKPALRQVSFVLEPGESVGFVGRSGSGKTTLVDILLGLYTPEAGQIVVGDVPLVGAALADWRARVGYVPQSIFLANASVAENIAFGLAPAVVDRAAVEDACRLAQVDDFVSQLPHGLDTIVGERGVKLSGGQRQRLGIARALYHRPDVLIFDEATSALDGLTEDAVMQAIHALRGTRTVVLIAHRLRTVQACGRIIMLENGSVVASGRYEDLLTSSPEFRRLVGGLAHDEDLVEAAT